jgi:hypothetical protein
MVSVKNRMFYLVSISLLLSLIMGVFGNVLMIGTLNVNLCNVINLNVSNITIGMFSVDRIVANSITIVKLNFMLV